MIWWLVQLVLEIVNVMKAKVVSIKFVLFLQKKEVDQMVYYLLVLLMTIVSKMNYVLGRSRQRIRNRERKGFVRRILNIFLVVLMSGKIQLKGIQLLICLIKILLKIHNFFLLALNKLILHVFILKMLKIWS